MNMVLSFRKHICVTSCTSEKLRLYLKHILHVTAWKYNWTEILGIVHWHEVYTITAITICLVLYKYHQGLQYSIL